jgi:hypothetical protein
MPDELDGGRVGQPQPQQSALTVVITEDDGLARGDALLRERHDQGTELGVGAVETGLVEVARLAAGGAGPHYSILDSPGGILTLMLGHRNSLLPRRAIPSSRRTPVGYPGPERPNQPAQQASSRCELRLAEIVRSTCRRDAVGGNAKDRELIPQGRYPPERDGDLRARLHSNAAVSVWAGGSRERAFQAGSGSSSRMLLTKVPWTYAYVGDLTAAVRGAQRWPAGATGEATGTAFPAEAGGVQLTAHVSRAELEDRLRDILRPWKHRRSPQPGCTPVHADDRLGRRAQWPREQ